MADKPSFIFAVDVDLTVVDSLTPWLEWFYAETGRFVENREGAYDLVPEMRAIIAEEGLTLDPFSYWLKHDLYDSLAPLEGCERVLKGLHDAGHKILFVSLCEPEHIRSKRRFLNNFFPYNVGFIDTAEKHFVKYDVLIDDKEDHIKKGLQHNGASGHILLTQVSRETVKYCGSLKETIHWDVLYDSLILGA